MNKILIYFFGIVLQYHHKAKFGPVSCKLPVYHYNKLVGTAAIVIQIILALFWHYNYVMDISPIPYILFYIYFMITLPFPIIYFFVCYYFIIFFYICKW